MTETLREPIDQLVERQQPLEEMTAEFRRLKESAAPLFKKMAKLKAKILARVPEGQLYSDASITLKERRITDVNSEKLSKALDKEEGRLDAASRSVLVSKKVEAFASLDPKLEKVWEETKIRQVLVTLTGSDDDDE